MSAALAQRPELIRVAAPESDALGRLAVAGERVIVADRHHLVHSFDGDLRARATYDAGDGHRDIIDPPVAASDDVVAVTGSPGDPASIRLLDPATLTELPTQLSDLPGEDFILDLSMSADGHRLAAVYNRVAEENLAAGDEPIRMRVWDLHSGRPVGPEFHHVFSNWSGVALSDNGSTLFTSNPVAAWDAATGKQLWAADMPWNNAIDVHGDTLASVTEDSRGVELRDIRTGDVTATLTGAIGGITDLAFSPDGALLAASGDGSATVWNVESRRPIHRFDTGDDMAHGPAFSADGRTLYVALPTSREIEAWDLEGSRTFLARLGYRDLPTLAAGTVRLTADGTRLALAGWSDGDRHIMALALFNLPTRSLFAPPTIGFEWQRAGTWSPDGQRYVAGYGDGWVQVIDAARGREVNRRQVVDGMVVALAFVGSERVAVADDSGHLHLLDADTLSPAGTTAALPEHIAAIGGTDGHTVVALGAGAEQRSDWDLSTRTWFVADLDTGALIRTGELTMPQALTLAVAPDGRHVAFGGRNGFVEVVNLETGDSIRPAMSVDAGDVRSIAYSPDGTRILTGPEGRTMGLWDAATGTPLASFPLPFDGASPALAFVPDGGIVAASPSGSVYAWDPAPAAAVRFACAVAGRDLTVQEWSDAFGDVPYRPTCQAVTPNG